MKKFIMLVVLMHIKIQHRFTNILHCWMVKDDYCCNLSSPVNTGMKVRGQDLNFQIQRIF